MTLARLAQQHPQKLPGKKHVPLCGRIRAFARPKKCSDQHDLHKRDLFALTSNLVGNPAKPGRAKLSPAGSGTPARAASLRAARFIRHQKTFKFSTRNTYFWGGPSKPIISPTRNAYFRTPYSHLPCMTPARLIQPHSQKLPGNIFMRPYAV